LFEDREVGGAPLERALLRRKEAHRRADHDGEQAEGR